VEAMGQFFLAVVRDERFPTCSLCCKSHMSLLFPSKLTPPPSPKKCFLQSPARSLQTDPTLPTADRERPLKLRSLEVQPTTAPHFIQPIATPIRTPASSV